MLVLISGILCLLAAGYLLYVMFHLSQEAGQALQKMGWMYFCILLAIGLHHIVISMMPLQDDFFLLMLNTVQDGSVIFIAIFGILFSGFLSMKYRDHKIASNTQVSDAN